MYLCFELWVETTIFVYSLSFPFADGTVQVQSVEKFNPMAILPLHKASQFSDIGVCLRSVTPELSKDALRYAHQDEYYMMGLIRSGSYCLSVDFKEYRCSGDEMVLVLPGQVHRFVEADGIEAAMLMVDGALVDDACRLVFDEYALCTAPFTISSGQRSELEHLFSMMAVRLDQADDAVSKGIVRSLVKAVMGIVAEAVRAGVHRSAVSRRSIEIVLQFKYLLHDSLCSHRSPSHYASLLHISPLYLNEVVRAVTGLSVSRYIQNELVLRAKRLLVYSSKSIQEIAWELGVEDYAYFSRLFAKATGVSPSAFRKNYLD